MVDSLIYLKVHDTEYGAMVAMCDFSVVDKILEEGEVLIDVKNYKSFYIGDKMSKEEAVKFIKMIKKWHSINIVGKESVEIALETKMIKKSNVMSVEGVPYAQAYNVNIGK